jgi:hypothetical protein
LWFAVTDLISVMPRYFFNTRIGERLFRIRKAKTCAIRIMRRVARATIRQILQDEGKDPSLLTAILK